MKYNLASEAEALKAFGYLSDLSGKHALVEVKKISPKRSLSQNSFLHLLIGAFGAHFGYSLAEAKIVYKDINKGVYAYDKKGRTFYHSSADLNKEDMSKTIDRFREASAEAGYPLPLATDQEWIRQLDNAIEQSKYYL